MEIRMDDRLQKALDFSNFVETQNNQKRIFLKQLKENLIHYTHGHQITITQQLISFCQSCIQLQQEVLWLLDDNNIPFEVKDLQAFTDEILRVYIFAMRKYTNDYSEIKKNRSVEGLVDL